MTIFVFSLLSTFCFLYVLNLHLRGTKKEFIETILGILIIASVVFAFFLNKWWYGLIAIFSMFFLIGIFRPFAQLLAYKLLGYRSGIDDKPTQSVDYFLKTINESGNWDEAMKLFNVESENNKKRLLKIYNRPKIQLLLHDNKTTLEDFYNLYMNINAILHDIAWEIFDSPVELKKLIEFKKRNASDDEIINYFRYNSFK